MEKVIRSIPQTIYIAEDGSEFTSELDCIFYEWQQAAQEVFVVVDTITKSTIGVFNSKASAEQFYSTDRYKIQAILVDAIKVKNDLIDKYKEENNNAY